MWHSNGGGNILCYHDAFGGGCDGDKDSVNNGNESDGVVDKDNGSVVTIVAMAL